MNENVNMLHNFTRICDMRNAHYGTVERKKALNVLGLHIEYYSITHMTPFYLNFNNERAACSNFFATHCTCERNTWHCIFMLKIKMDSELNPAL
jgi:hypothetical protein